MGNGTTSDSANTDDDRVEPPARGEQPVDKTAADLGAGDESGGAGAAGATSGTDTGGTGGSAAGTSTTTRDPGAPEAESGGGDGVDPARPDGRVLDRDPGSEPPAQGDGVTDDGNEDEEALLTVYTDPWDTVGWANEPELRTLEVAYPDALGVEYAVLPPRTVDTVDRNHGMPVSPIVIPPRDTETSYRALRAADERGRLRPFLRRLRVAALSEARDVEARDVLLELAAESGLDPERLRDDMDAVALPEDEETAPQVVGRVGGEPHRWSGTIQAERLRVRFADEGVEPTRTSVGVGGLVERHGPVSTAELRAAYGETPAAGEALARVEFGDGEFWTTPE